MTETGLGQSGESGLSLDVPNGWKVAFRFVLPDAAIPAFRRAFEAQYEIFLAAPDG
jgi:hypothetical protein